MKVTRDPKLLILDWGIGGIGTFLKMRSARPDLDIVYISDAGQVPYGKQTQIQLSGRVQALVELAEQRGATHAIVACNAASTILQISSFSIPVLGVIEKGLDALAGSEAKHLGVIGGERTILSGAWTTPLEAMGFRVSAKVAQALSALIERGQHRALSSRPVFSGVLSGLEEVDLLVLACTHYVAASALISEILPGVHLYDPVDACIDYAIKEWPLSGGRGNTEFLTSGDVDAMIVGAKLAYDYDIPFEQCESI